MTSDSYGLPKEGLVLQWGSSPQLRQSLKQLTAAAGCLLTTWPTSGEIHPLTGIWAAHLRSTTKAHLHPAFPMFNVPLFLFIMWDTNTLSMHFHFCQIKVKLDFHLPPRKSWLISSSQIAPQNTFSTPLAMKCLYFPLSTHSFMQQVFPEHPLCARQKSKSYLSQSSSYHFTVLRKPFLINGPSAGLPSFERQ